MNHHIEPEIIFYKDDKKIQVLRKVACGGRTRGGGAGRDACL